MKVRTTKGLLMQGMCAVVMTSSSFYPRDMQMTWTDAEKRHMSSSHISLAFNCLRK